MKFSIAFYPTKGSTVYEFKGGVWKTFNEGLNEEEVIVIRNCLMAWGWKEV